MKGNGRNGSSKEVPAVITRTIDTAVMLLERAGAQFKVIAPDGREFGRLEERTTGSFKHRHPYRKLSNYYKPYIEKLQPGDVAQVPIVQDFPTRDLRSAVTAYCSAMWGAGSYRSCTTDTHIEILRVQ